MLELLIRKVKDWATKDGSFHGLQFMDRNINKFEVRNEDYDKSLDEENITPFPAISTEFPGVYLGRETPAEINPSMVPYDGNDDIQRQAMIVAQNTEYNPNEIADVEDEEVVEE